MYVCMYVCMYGWMDVCCYACLCQGVDSIYIYNFLMYMI